MTKEKSFLGKGWAFPPGLNGKGHLKEAQYEESICQAIHLILSTARGERVMRPEFGCDIHDYLFESLNATTLTQVREAVRRALIRWEPRIILEEVEVSPQEGKLLVEITYRVRSTNHRGNLVWPFYLKEGGA